MELSFEVWRQHSKASSNGFWYVNGLQSNFRMSQSKNSKHLVNKTLAYHIDTLKVEYHGLKLRGTLNHPLTL